MKNLAFTISLIILLSSACTTYKPYYKNSIEKITNQQLSDNDSIEHCLYLIGNTGYESSATVLYALDSLAKSTVSEKSIVFLGNNVCPSGLSDEEDDSYARDTLNLNIQLNAIKNFDGKRIFIPGNSDWNNGKNEGEDILANQEEYIEQYLIDENVFYPPDGCPGPVEIELSDNIVLVVVDTQWWLHQYDKPQLDKDCDIQDVTDLLIQITYTLRRNKNKHIIFAAHHPLFSVGKHGGHFPPDRNIFPLRELNNNMFVPLPGFIYTLYRKYIGDIQDIAHPEYQEMKQAFVEIFKEFPNLIYASGHENNLQYLKNDSIHYLISGAGGNISYTAKNKRAEFACAKEGFSRLLFYKNGDAVVEYFVCDSTALFQLAYRKTLYNKQIINKEINHEIYSVQYKDSFVTVCPSTRYKADKLKKIFMGENYRTEWETPVTFPVFDIGTIYGGLTITKRGGGWVSRSFRLQDRKGNQYVLRSVDKYAEKNLPKEIINTFAVDAVQDQISAAHPYAAIMIPPLAEVAGIHHTNPQYFFVPDDPRLGQFRNDMANQIFLFEERLSSGKDKVESFGNPDEIISTPQLLKKNYKDADEIIDQKTVLKCRLFDILINDWDRHDDQWRFAKFKYEDKNIYQPIPRDRDMAFYIRQGVLPTIAGQPWALRKLQGFEPETNDVQGLIFNARFFDRTFLNQMTKNDWLIMSDFLQETITDSIIEAAVHQLPDTIFALGGETIIKTLIERRNNLKIMALKAYSFLAKNVDITGTNDRDFFQIERLNDNETRVRIYELTKKKAKIREQYYDRTFITSETNEIRLYGLNGKDKFLVTGNVDNGIKIRIIGGKGKDEIIDSSAVKGISKKTLVYDKKNKNELITGTETKDLTSKKNKYNKYKRNTFKYNRLAPTATVGYNRYDGFIYGFGLVYTTHGFKKNPFATQQKLLLIHETKTEALNIEYFGIFTEVIKECDFIANIELKTPDAKNYFGLSNESVINEEEPESYYLYKNGNYIIVNPMLSRKITKDSRFNFGLFYKHSKLDSTGRKLITEHFLEENIFESRDYFGANFSYDIDNRDDKILPRRGILWENSAKYFHGINSNSATFVNLFSDLSLYFSFKKSSPFVFAFRVGGAANFGDYDFFNANDLCGSKNLRGYLRTRFTGDKIFYQNSEIRMKLFPFSNYLLTGSLGLLVFNDIGRVWVTNENSQKWHNGYGGGLWLSPFEMAILNISYYMSEENNMWRVRLRYFF